MASATCRNMLEFCQNLMNIFFACKLGYIINKSAAYISLLILKTKECTCRCSAGMFQVLKGDGAVLPCMASL